MANSITRCTLVIMLSLVYSFAYANSSTAAPYLALYSEHQKPVYLAVLTNQSPLKPAQNLASLQQSSMAFIFQRDYPIRQIVRHIGSWALIGNKADPSYAKAVNSESLAAIYRLNKQLFDLKKQMALSQGDRLQFSQKGSQTFIHLNNTEVSRINDPAFYPYLANMWLGQSAASKPFQEQLFSNSKALRALYSPQTTTKKAATVVKASKNTSSKPVLSSNTNTRSTKTTKDSSAGGHKTSPATATATATAIKNVAGETALPSPSKVTNKPKTQPHYSAQQQPFKQAQQSNYQRLLLAIKNADFPINQQAINAVILFTDHQGNVLNAKVVSETVKNSAMLSKKIAFISQTISPIVTTKAMQQPGIYAFTIPFKPEN